METTDWDIKCIDFGNQQLDNWLKNEEVFMNRLVRSQPFRYCMCTVYGALVRLGELPLFRDAQNDEQIKEHRQEAIKWADDLSKVNQITQCISVLSVLAEKRLKNTVGI